MGHVQFVTGGRCFRSPTHRSRRPQSIYGQFFAFRYPACAAAASLANVTILAELTAAKPGQSGRWESMEMLGIRPPQVTPRPLYRDTIA